MVKEQIQDSEFENDDIHRLLMNLKRVEAPKDFDFKVKARIAAGRPAEGARSWVPAFARVAVPAALVLSVGGYVGYWGYADGDAAQTVAVAHAPEIPPAAPQESEDPFRTPAAADPVQMASVPEARTENTSSPAVVSSTAVKTPKRPATAAPTAENTPSGGSYDIAAPNAKKISQELKDVDDLAEPTAPVRRVLVSAGEFLRSVGIASTATGNGGKITGVSGAAAAIGVQAGDVIESVNVQTRTVRVTRDGRSLTFQIR